jgi:transposase
MDATADMDVASLPLPGDVQACHAMILQLLAAQREQSRLIGHMQHQLEQLLRRLYGRSSEKLDPNQQLLFAEILAQLQPPPALEAEPAPVATPAKPVKTPHGRRQFPANLPRERKEHKLPEDQKPCPCCGKERHQIGEEVTEKIEYVPARVVVLQNVQFKYACAHCEAEAKSPQIVLAEKPPEAIEKCMAGPGLLAYVIVGKYSDHLPLHRLEKILARHDIDIARSTMCDWMSGCAAALRPLYDLMKSRVLRSAVIHTDDTPVDVLDKNRKDTRTARFWVYLGDKEHPDIVFDYTPSRSRDGPEQFLGNWGGEKKVYLQADAFGGYDGIYVAPPIHAPATDAPPAQVTGETMGATAAPQAGNLPSFPLALVATRGAAAPIEPGRGERALFMINAFLSTMIALSAGIVEVACWAHARRKFYEARTSDPARSAQALAYIRLLYDVEDQAKEQSLNPAQRAALRHEMALPRLAQFKVWLESQQPSEGGAVLPKSPMGAAITYALNQYNALCVYVLDGNLAIDNNAAENAERRIAVGRKNWLFCGSDAGGQTAAILFSLIATCERHKVNPWEYLRDVLSRIAMTPISKLIDLLPDQWKLATVTTTTPSADQSANQTTIPMTEP